QTVRYRRELGQEIEPSLPRRAAERLYRGGKRAGERGDRPAACSLLTRALALIPEDDPLRAGVAVELADQLVERGDSERMEAALAAAERDPRVTAFAALIRFEWVLRTRPREAMAMMESRLPRIIREFERAEDDRGLAKAHFAWMLAHVLSSEQTQWAEHAKLAAEHAGRAGDEGLRA